MDGSNARLPPRPDRSPSVSRGACSSPADRARERAWTGGRRLNLPTEPAEKLTKRLPRTTHDEEPVINRRSQRDAGEPVSNPRLGVVIQVSLVVAWCALWGYRSVPLHVSPKLAIPALSSLAAGACWLRVVVRHRERLVWALFATGSSCYAAGWVILFHLSADQSMGLAGLNLSDSVSLLMYPTWLAALLLSTRARFRTRADRAGVDGAVVALAVGAVSLSVFAAIVPGAFRSSWIDAVYAAAYPIGSAVLLVTALTLLAVLRLRVRTVWSLLPVAFAVMFAGEALFARRAAAGGISFGTSLDMLYLAGPVLVSVAAWQAAGPAQRRQTTSSGTMLLTAVATLSALGVLVLRTPGTPALATGLAACAVVAAVVRTALFITQEQLLAVRTTEALTDPLTGLANRRALLDRLAGAASGTAEGSVEAACTLAIVDLERFKSVNESLGRGAGDELLRRLADRLSHAVPADALLARLGGDEFALLLPCTVAEAAVEAARLREVIGQPFDVNGHELRLGSSWGLTSTSAAAEGSESLRQADVALYAAKQDDQGVQLWTSDLDDAGRELLRLISDLRAALQEDDQLLVHLQPKCHPATGQILALEALVRWQHPVLGLIFPDRLLPAATAAGLLPELTLRVLDLALAGVVSLRAAGHDVPVAVNVTAPDLLDPRFASRVAQTLDRHHLTTASLRLEVTETVVLHNPAQVVRTLRLLSSIGIGLSLDDYGTGLASLTYLRDLPIDELKIDRSFVTHYLTDATSRIITDSTLELAHNLGLTVVAEGIEDRETGQALAQAGCDLLQGYWCGRPAAVHTLVALLEEAEAADAAPVPAPRRSAAPDVLVAVRD